MGKMAVAIDLSKSERGELTRLASWRRMAHGLAQRARIVLMAAEGAENKTVGLRVGAAPNTVGKWRRRFAERRIDGLLDEPRPGAPRQIGDDEVAEVIRQTLETAPPGAMHWSPRSMAKAAGFAPSQSACEARLGNAADAKIVNGEQAAAQDPVARKARQRGFRH